MRQHSHYQSRRMMQCSLRLLLIAILLSHPLRTSAQDVISFNLVQAGTNRTVAPLFDGAVIVFPPNLTATGLAIDALTTGSPIASVVFGYNTTRNFSVEKTAPYAMCGNTGVNFKRCPFLTVGTHRINATISNVAGRSRIITFTLVNASSVVNASLPVAAPAPVPFFVPVPAPRPTAPVPLPTAPVPIAPVPLPIAPVPLPVAPVPRPIAPVPVPIAPVPLPTAPVPPPITPAPVVSPVQVTRTSAPTVTPRVVPVLPPIMAAPVAPPTGVPPILTFTLIYAVNHTDIMPLVNGSVVQLSAFDVAKFNIRADTTNRTLIQSIQFLPSGQSETSQPWAYCGNSGPIYNPCSDLGAEGYKTITARPYAGKYLTGTLLPDVTITVQFLGRPAPPVENQFPIYISCGSGTAITDNLGRVWRPDVYFSGGGTYANTGVDILNRVGNDELIFQSERYGNFVYNIPVPLGSYSVVLHFAEIYFTTTGSRIFDIQVEDSVILDIDIVDRASGLSNFAIAIDIPVPVADGFLTITAMENVPRVDNAKISAIEVQLIGPHNAHAVTGGPYTVVDTDGDGFAVVAVDATESHTHGVDERLSSFTWKNGNTIIGTGNITSFTLPVGEHVVTLTVTTSNDRNTDTTTITVLPKSFPSVTSIDPTSGNVAGGTLVTITGTGLEFATAVRFGTSLLTGSAVTVVNANTITVEAPLSGSEVPAPVSVITPTAESNSKIFNFIAAIPIRFNLFQLLSIEDPTAVAFGPDSKLYVGTLKGQLGKYTLNENFDAVLNSVVVTINATRGIHGIAFDPLDNANTLNPTIYISTSDIFHNEARNSVGDAVNGKIQTVRGANLDLVTDIVRGLPVSALDHSVNGIYFGNNGELYIAVGGNTNGGIPGELSRSLLMRENYFSSAILVANLGSPSFNGFITYNAVNDGSPITGFGPNGVEVFASGLRNPFGVVMHSNGRIYATDNGPNGGFGDMATGCGPGQFIPDVYDSDELNLIVRNAWYGHPNHKRAQTDPRQCVWKGTAVASTSDYTAPLMKLRSSTDGIIEYQANHFAGEMRSNLIASKYGDGLYRIILSADGNSVVSTSIPAISLAGDNGLAVTQAPNGNLIDARYDTNECYVFIPEEPPTAALQVFSIFPRRGGLAGGSTVAIYGANFVAELSFTIEVSIGGSPCTNIVVNSSNSILRCTLPPSTSIGRKDVVVDVGNGVRVTLPSAYLYITGRP